MIQVGQFFKKGNKEYGLLDVIEYNNQNYFYFSVEENGKVDYEFYILKSFDKNEGYDFGLVEDKNLFNELFAIEVERIKAEI